MIVLNLLTVKILTVFLSHEVSTKWDVAVNSPSVSEGVASETSRGS